MKFNRYNKNGVDMFTNMNEHYSDEETKNFTDDISKALSSALSSLGFNSLGEFTQTLKDNEEKKEDENKSSNKKETNSINTFGDIANILMDSIKGFGDIINEDNHNEKEGKISNIVNEGKNEEEPSNNINSEINNEYYEKVKKNTDTAYRNISKVRETYVSPDEEAYLTYITKILNTDDLMFFEHTLQTARSNVYSNVYYFVSSDNSIQELIIDCSNSPLPLSVIHRIKNNCQDLLSLTKKHIKWPKDIKFSMQPLINKVDKNNYISIEFEL